MALKSKLLPVPNDPSWGRDRGKLFLITEMPAAQAEKWAYRIFLALKGSDAQVPLEIRNLGMVGVAIVSFNVILRSTVKFEELEPLLDEMFTCVRAVPDPRANQDSAAYSRPLIEGEVEEVPTRAWLRSQVLELHTGFSIADAMSKFLSEVSTAAASLTT